MKVSISKWALIEDLGIQDKDALKKKLTVFPVGIPELNPNPSPIAVYTEKDGCFGVPREYYFNELKKDDDKVIYEWICGNEVQIRSSVILKPDQKVFFETLKSGIEERGGIIVAPAGYGKTILGICIAEYLNKKTLIVTHRDGIMRQWKDKFTGLPM